MELNLAGISFVPNLKCPIFFKSQIFQMNSQILHINEYVNRFSIALYFISLITRESYTMWAKTD